VEGESRRRGLADVHPILVRPDGVDEFYGRHRYDVVLLANVYDNMKDRVELIKRLRDSLKDGGRLLYVTPLEFCPFRAEDFFDPEGLYQELLREPADSPWRKYLSPSGEVPQAADLRPYLAAVFNQMHVAPSFAEDFTEPTDGGTFKKGISFPPDEEDCALAMLMHRAYGPLRINKMIIRHRFRPWLAPEPKATLRHLKEFESAGYRLQERFDSSRGEVGAVFVKSQ
jgi:hypothetical protein